MAVDFKSSQTKDNLMRALQEKVWQEIAIPCSFTGKSKAIMLLKQFRFAADQEKEHAEIFIII